MYIKVEATIVVEAEEGLGVEDIMDAIDINPTTEDENFDIYDCEVDRYYVEDSK